MESVKFIKAQAAMCIKYPTCEGCPIMEFLNNVRPRIEIPECRQAVKMFPEQIVCIVESWSESHLNMELNKKL